jgi:endogenous inhibitor of DNA gyrase (YacG/DUF329 family)
VSKRKTSRCVACGKDASKKENRPIHSFAGTIGVYCAKCADGVDLRPLKKLGRS